MVALDVEFVSEGRYIPELALVQIAFEEQGKKVAYALDPQTANLQPVLALISDPQVAVLGHAARQDLALLWSRSHVKAQNFIDTQIAAAFAGLGEQIGYARLVRELTGVELDKELQWTDWARRPLSDRQLSYALNDVLYLLPCWAELKRRLEGRDRLSWVVEESTALTRSAVLRRSPEEAYQYVGGWNSLKGAQLGSLRALAAWRETMALDTNKPPSWLLPDAAMVDLSRKQAKTERALRRARGLNPGVISDHGHTLLDLIAKGAENPPTLTGAQEALTTREQALVSVVLGILQARCMDEELPPRFAGTRGDAEELVRHAMRDGIPAESVMLLGGWRKTMVGGEILDWLRGKKTLVTVGDRPGGLVLR